jgi:cell division protein FtsX
MRGSLSAIKEWLRVPIMSKEETMKDLMNQELNEAIATLNRANNALSRIFNVEEGEEENNEH